MPTIVDDSLEKPNHNLIESLLCCKRSKKESFHFILSASLFVLMNRMEFD